MGPYWVLLAVAITATLTLPVAVLVFAPTPVSSQETRAARLVASVAADKETYLPGEPVIITFRVMNEGNGIADIRFGSTCLATYSILSMDGAVAYDHKSHAACGQILTNIGLETAVMHFHTPCFVQFLVLDEARDALFNSSRWWGCVQILANEILAPGESRTWVFPWGLTTDAGGPLGIGQQYEVVPSFLWIYPDYQRNVSRTTVATFTMAAFTT